MSALAVSLIAFACYFGGAMAGMFLNKKLPDHHRSDESKRVVNLGAGIIGTMAALVLGLLVAGAKSNYDAQNSELTTQAAKIILVDRGLRFYGPQAAGTRVALREFVESTITRMWPKEHVGRPMSESSRQNAALEIYEDIERLSPQNDMQKTIKGEITATMMDLVQRRWLMVEQSKSSVSIPLLVILIFSLAINFVSFGLFAPRNATVIVTLFLCAIAAAGSIFLILELYQPFGGLIQIPSTTLRDALAQMGQ